MENCTVSSVRTEGGKVKAVETSRGVVECEHFVNSAGDEGYYLSIADT